MQQNPSCGLWLGFVTAPHLASLVIGEQFGGRFVRQNVAFFRAIRTPIFAE